MPSPDMSLWQGRDDTGTEGPEALRMHQCVKSWSEESPPSVCLLGFACDEGVRRNQGRVGSAEGPTALRRALANLAWNHHDGINDAGDVRCDDGDLERAQAELGQVIGKLIQGKQHPIVLGGGHETAWGSFLGLTMVHPDAKVGIINLDAHFDLRPGPVAHSGTPFRQMAEWHELNNRPFSYLCLGVAEPSNTSASMRVANELEVVFRWDEDLGLYGMDAANEIEAFTSNVDLVYLSLDLDVLPGSVMPAVSAPAGYGVPLETIEWLVRQIGSSGKLAVADVVEFNPTHDRDGLAARTAARLIWRLARHWSTVEDDRQP